MGCIVFVIGLFIFVIGLSFFYYLYAYLTYFLFFVLSDNPYPDVRQRYWNAYMLFYEKADEVVKTPRTPRKTPNKFSFRKSDRDLSSINRYI